MKHFMDISRIKENEGSELTMSNIGAFQPGDIIQISEKVDGCFAYDARVLLADGSKMPIGKIVNQKLDVEVLSYNFETNQLEPSKITNYYNHGAKKPFIEIKYTSHIGSNKCRILCTEDHLFYTNIGWIPAGKLHSGLTLYTTDLNISEEQKQLVLGTMLGDSALYPVLSNNNAGRTHGITYTHSNKQLEYVEFKNKILGNLFLKSESIITGYESNATRNFSHCTLSIENEIKKCINKNLKKEVNVQWLSNITSLGLAFWYMDDGSLMKGSNHQRERACLHTEGFTKEENDIIIEMLYIKFGIIASKIFYKNKYYRIDLSADGSDRFFSMISPYVINSMKYKLPEKYQNNCGSYWNDYSFNNSAALISWHIDEVNTNPSEQLIKQHGKNNYDIETENHNYFVGDFLVHNSNASIALDEEGNLVAFSRKQQLDYNNNLRGFWNYVQTLDKEKFQDLGKRVCFGEFLVSHTVKYNADAYNKWYVYDMYDTETEEWLPQSVVKEFAEAHGLEYIHVLYEGEFISWDHCRTFLNSPAYGDKQEGIVVKNMSKLNSPDVRQPFYLKIVNDSFMETKAHNHIKKMLDPQHQEEKNQAEEIANEVVTKARVQKEIHKMIDEGILPEKLQPKDMSMVARNLPKRIYDDIVKEELERISDTIGNQYFGKAVNAITMNYAKNIILG